MNKHDLVVCLSERLFLTQSQSVEIVNAWEGRSHGRIAVR